MTWVTVKGRFESDCCSPALTCANALLESMARNIPATANRFIKSVLYRIDIFSADACGCNLDLEYRA